jgi:undecaprenyl diphosphate synthase
MVAAAPDTPPRVPRHVAIIMDGNGRWAASRGEPRNCGHRAGARAAREVVEAAHRMGVEVLTLFAFSSENWHRPTAEVRVLMDLFMRTIREETPELRDNGVRLRFIGERSHFPEALRRHMERAEASTAGNDGLRLLIAVDYGGRWDILRAARRLAAEVAEERLAPEDIDEDRFSNTLSLAGYSAPDLFIRTGGERRLSNFLLWDLAYTEMYFSDVLWPDFDADAFADAVAWFAGRERRFGRVRA